LAVGYLTFWLIQYGHNRYWVRHVQPPSTALDILDCMVPRKTRFQFSILSMLALMLGIALILLNGGMYLFHSELSGFFMRSRLAAFPGIFRGRCRSEGRFSFRLVENLEI
jgi:hypothetical protein